MNILFVNYGDFTTNSLNHIAGFANTLVARGHACIVAVASDRDSLSAVAAPLFIPALHADLLAQPALFPDNRPADIIHAWTPREGVRKFVVAYQKRLARPARVIIHLEDNEEFLLSSYAGRPFSDLCDAPAEDLDRLVVDGLPHPLRHRAFLACADAVTVITDRLREFVPPHVPTYDLPPGVDFDFYQPQAPDQALRAELGLAPGEKVIAFTGSNTFANEPEMRELYVAIRLLNQRGVPTRLIRTGFSHPKFVEGLPEELRAHVLNLGFVAKAQLPRLLALADVLVQPGRCGPFNDYRLPSKLPEFLASGRPVILPPTNLARAMEDGRDGLFLKTGAPDEIADLCQTLFADGALAARLGTAGRAYARTRFDLAANTSTLEATYRAILAASAPSLWAQLADQGASELALLPTLFATHPSAVTWKSGALVSAFARLVQQMKHALAAADSERIKADQEHVLVAEKLALTTRHAANLEALVAESRLQLATTRELTAQHIANLEDRLATQRSQADAARLLTDQHVANIERSLAAAQTSLRAAEGRVAETLAKLAEVDKYGRDQASQLAQTRLQLQETERIARERVEAAEKNVATLADRAAHAEAVIRTRDEKIARMQRSLSWQLTSPLRALRRAVVDKPKATPGNVVAAPGPHGKAPINAPVADPASTPTPAPVCTPLAYGYTYNFDHPRGWNTVSNKLLILGWCFENNGTPIQGLRARFGDEIVEGIYGSKRLDVLASVGGKKQAEYCGIKIDIKTTLGDHRLVVEVLHETGWNAFYETTVHVGKPGDPTELSEYEKWCDQHEALSADDLQSIKEHIARFAQRPLISVIMPTYNPPELLLVKAIESVRAQLYPHWELCIADDASTQPHVRAVLERFAREDARIKVTFREKNGHISAATNTAIEQASGEWIALFDHDDVLHRCALYEATAEINAHPDAAFIYTDEDKIDGEDHRFDPYFKPDWNPDLLLAQNYTSHLSFFRTALVRSAGGLRLGYEGSQDWDLTLRIVEQVPTSAIRHVPKVLYHWRAIPGSTALQLSEKSYPVDAARRALLDHFQRTGQTIELVTVPGDHWRIKYPIPNDAPLVSLIIPTRNALKLVRQAVESVVTKTSYPRYEILIVDNGSDDPETLAWFNAVQATPPTTPVGVSAAIKVLRYDAPFNYSAINNFAAARANGTVIGLLNNDVEVINADWLDEMVSQALRPGVGAVGAMLYYPMNTVQHAGVILGLGGVAGHPFKEFPRGDQGQKNRLRLVQNYSAVTAACVVLTKSAFTAVGGLNEKHLAVAFNDVDLCCKLLAAGYRNVWTPFAELYHHESATRGIEDTPEKKARFQAEVDYMMETWGDLLADDPAYNPNLTLVGEDFSTAYLPRTQKPWMAKPGDSRRQKVLSNAPSSR